MISPSSFEVATKCFLKCENLHVQIAKSEYCIDLMIFWYLKSITWTYPRVETAIIYESSDLKAKEGICSCFKFWILKNYSLFQISQTTINPSSVPEARYSEVLENAHERMLMCFVDFFGITSSDISLPDFACERMILPSCPHEAITYPLWLHVAQLTNSDRWRST